MKTLNGTQIAVIGCGRIAGHHSRSILKTSGLELVAVCDMVSEKAEAYGKEFSRPWYTNYREMFAKHPEIGTVVVVTPSGMHFEHAMEVLTVHKKNVVVEKPTFMRPSEMTKAFDAAEKSGLQVFPIYQNRHNKAVVRVAQGVKNGELGAIRVASVRMRWCRPQRYYGLAPWRGTFSHDGGALTNQGVHYLDLVKHLAGDIEKVSATMRTLGVEIEVEDTVVGSMAFKNGAVGSVEITTAARPQDYEASISLVCENGLAQIGGIAANELQTYTPDPKACAQNSEDFSGCVYGSGHEKIYQEIQTCVVEGKPFSVTRKDALNSLRLLHAFYRSDEKNSWVDVEVDEDSKRLGQPNEKISNLYRTPS